MSSKKTLGILVVLVVTIIVIRLEITSRAPSAATPSPSPTAATQADTTPLTTTEQTASAPLTHAPSATPSPLPTASATVSLPDAQEVTRPTIAVGDVTPVDTSKVDMTDPDAVADLFAATVSSSDTDTDTSWVDASRRARSLMTDELAETTMTQVPGGQDAQWLDLEEHDGYTTAQVRESLDGVPTDSADEAFRVRIATRDAVGRDGWQGESDSISYYLTMVKVDGQWRVSQVQTSDYSEQ